MLIYFDIFVKDFLEVFILRNRRGRSRGTGPRATVKKKPSLHRRARACPSPGNDRGGQAPALRKPGRFYRRARDGPAHHPCRAGSPDPAKFRAQASPNYRVGDTPGYFSIVGCGPVPRQHSRARMPRGGRAPAFFP